MHTRSVGRSGSWASWRGPEKRAAAASSSSCPVAAAGCWLLAAGLCRSDRFVLSVGACCLDRHPVAASLYDATLQSDSLARKIVDKGRPVKTNTSIIESDHQMPRSSSDPFTKLHLRLLKSDSWIIQSISSLIICFHNLIFFLVYPNEILDGRCIFLRSKFGIIEIRIVIPIWRVGCWREKTWEGTRWFSIADARHFGERSRRHPVPRDEKPCAFGKGLIINCSSSCSNREIKSEGN